jgi:hypothetical protein
MRTLAVGLTALALLAGHSSSASAQARPIELGIDAAVQVFLEDPRVTLVSIPVQQVRVGFFTSPTVSVEPTLAINVLRVEGFNVTQIGLGLGVLFHTSPDRTRPQTYFRPFFGVNSLSGGGESDSAGLLGIGAGIKSPFLPRLAGRFEGFLEHHFDDGGVTSIGVMFGLSFFPR